jgi:O-methyltransferase
MHPHPAVSLFPEWKPQLPWLAHIVNRYLRRWKTNLRLERVVNGSRDMTTVEQRFSLVQALAAVVESRVPGDIVECGCFEGKTTALLTRMLGEWGEPRPVHVFDSFGSTYFLGEASVEEALRQNFAQVNLPLPVIHRGLFQETIPEQLPEQIAFVHLDCGGYENPAIHQRSLEHCLSHLYPRLSPGGICVLMDYNDGTFVEIDDALPGVRRALDNFLADKPEKRTLLWGGQGGMAYFRRASAPPAACL